MDPFITLPAMLALGAVAGAAIGRRRDRKKQALAALREIDVPGSQRDAALLIALGHDPDRHRIRPVTKPFKGLQIVDVLNRNVRFWTVKQLRTDKVRKAWEAAKKTVKVTVEAA